MCAYSSQEVIWFLAIIKIFEQYLEIFVEIKRVLVRFCNVFLFVFVYKLYVDFMCMSLHLCLSRLVEKT